MMNVIRRILGAALVLCSIPFTLVARALHDGGYRVAGRDNPSEGKKQIDAIKRRLRAGEAPEPW